jgi:hypothetical protein
MSQKPPAEHPVLEGQISLDEYLNQLDGPLPETGDDATPDDATASRMLRELGTMEKAIAANSAMAVAERAKITQWETTVNEPLQNRALYLRSVLEQYAIHERTVSDRKTISLPFGTLSTRPATPVWDIYPAFNDWAKTAAPDLLKVTYTPIKNDIKAKFVVDSDGHAVDTVTGVMVPGIEVTQPTDYNVQIKTR